MGADVTVLFVEHVGSGVVVAPAAGGAKAVIADATRAASRTTRTVCRPAVETPFDGY